MSIRAGGRGAGHRSRTLSALAPLSAPYFLVPAPFAALQDQGGNYQVDQSGNVLTGQDGSGLYTGTSIKDIAASRGIRFGMAFTTSTLNADPAYAALVAAQADAYTPENDMKPGNIQATQGVFTFTAADAFAAKAQADGKSFRIHLLMYPAHDMPWVSTSTVTGSTYQGLIDSHFGAIAARPWAQQAADIDVINEVVDNTGLRSFPWTIASAANPFQIPGKPALNNPAASAYLYAFYRARQLFPSAKLYFCHDGTEQLPSDGFNDARASQILTVLQDLLQAGAPIDGMSIQGHLSFRKGTTATATRTFIRNVKALGLKVIVSEFDTRTGNVSPYIAANYSTTEYDRFAAEQSKQVLDVIVPEIDGGYFYVWTPTDKYSSWEAGERPGLYDANLAQKPLYTALRNVFLGL